MSTAEYSPLFDRPLLAKAFREAATGQTFAVVVNHFKSKGSCPASGPDVERARAAGTPSASRRRPRSLASCRRWGRGIRTSWCWAT